jgi:hypothetical protein
MIVNLLVAYLLSRKYPSLEKRGEGRFCDDLFTTKIPPNLPFPKGGIFDIFILFVDRRFMSDS